MKCFFKNKRVFITGHTGFKGSWLSEILYNFGAEVTGYALKPNTTPSLFEELDLQSKINSKIGDIRDLDSLKSVIDESKPEIVFHLAAQPIVRLSYDLPVYTYETNVMGAVNVLEAIRNVDSIKSVLIITTDKVYVDQNTVWPYRETDLLGGYDPYSASKACVELVVGSYVNSFFNPKKEGCSVNIASARAGNVIGGGDWAQDRLVPDIVRQIFSGDKNVEIRNPSAIRPWQHVLDPLMGYLQLSKKLYDGDRTCIGAWNFSPNDENFISVETLIKEGITILGEGSYHVKKNETKHETNILKLDSSKAKTHLDWRPHLNLNETLSWTFEWYKKYYGGMNIKKITDNQITQFFENVK